MRPRHSWFGLAVGFIVVAMASGASAQTALSGLVSSSEEGPMEGVLVSAKREGSTITTTVVTNEQGRYSFPSARMEPGKYTVSIRAIGYKLDGPSQGLDRLIGAFEECEAAGEVVMGQSVVGPELDQPLVDL